MIQRHLVPEVLEALQFSRIVNVVGPRQCGKSTLVQRQIPIAEYFTMDSDAVRESLRADAYGQLRILADRHQYSKLPIVLDEVQRLPEITLALKRVVDEDDRKGQFLLTGSADVFGLPGAEDSLAGRVHSLVLRPLSTAEVFHSEPCRLLDLVEESANNTLSSLPKPRSFSRSEALDQLVRGGFPEMRELGDRVRSSRYNSYIDSIIIRDVPMVAPVRKPDLLRRLVDQLAARTAQELNIASVCDSLGARKESVGNWLDILERLCLVQRLPSWASAATKRAVHWPKLHFLDSGCACALRNQNASSFELGADPTALGPLLESFVFQELEKSLPLLNSAWRLAHWRSAQGEIDLIAESPGRCLALFEVKATSSISGADFKPINWFLESGPGQAMADKSVGFVFYLGDQLVSMGPRRIGLPLSMLWSF